MSLSQNNLPPVSSDTGVTDFLASLRKTENREPSSGGFLGILERALGRVGDALSPAPEPVQPREPSAPPANENRTEEPAAPGARDASPRTGRESSAPGKGNSPAEGTPRDVTSRPALRDTIARGVPSARESAVRGSRETSPRTAGTAIPGSARGAGMEKRVDPRQAAKGQDASPVRSAGAAGTPRTALPATKTEADKTPGTGAAKSRKTHAGESDSDASRNQSALSLLDRALETLKGLAGAVAGKPKENQTRTLDSQELLARKAGTLRTRSASSVHGDSLAEKGGVALPGAAGKPVPARIRAAADPGEAKAGDARLARKLKVEDHRKTPASASLGAKGMAQGVENTVNQVLAQTASLKEAAQAGSGKARGKESLEFPVNAAWVPAADRIIRMPVIQTGQNPGQSLRDWLQQHGANALAREAKFVLKDGGAGEIRLILHPEELGEVRINMSIKDGHIAGNIFVENDEVRKAFEDQMAQLSQAFREQGFGDARLDVGLGGRESRDPGQFSGQEDDNSALRSARAVKDLERQVATVGTYADGQARVDLVI